MVDCLSALCLLAEEEQKQPGGSPLGSLLVPLVAMGLMWYLLILRPGRRDRAKRDALLKSLKKNDRVVTIGGILGTVVSVGQDDKEVTLRVDNNTRIRMLRSSIQTVLTDDKDEGTGKNGD